jgi:hypothetical protein
MTAMELAIGLTLYLSFGAFLFFGTMEVPAVFGRLAIGLCASEFVAAIAWGLYPSDTMQAIAGVQIPALTAGSLLLALGYGLHAARTW